MIKSFVTACVFMLSAQAANASGCYLRFDDANHNGVGSVEGSCSINEKTRVAPHGTPYVSVVLRGDGGEVTTLYSGYLPLNYGYPLYFDDQNQNGDGTVVGGLNLSVGNWRSRRVWVTLETNGQFETLFNGYI